MTKTHKAGTVIVYAVVIAICLFLISLLIGIGKDLKTRGKWRNADIARQTVLDKNQLIADQYVGSMESGSTVWISPSAILADREGKVYVDYNAPISPKRDADHYVKLSLTKDNHFEAFAESDFKIRSIEKLDIPHQIGRLYLTFKSEEKADSHGNF